VGTTRDARPGLLAGVRAHALGAPLGVVFLLVMVAFQVASGVSAEPVRFVGVTVAALAVCALAFAAAAYGPLRAVAAFGTATAVGFLAELAGVETGFPFGEYRYTEVLWPQPAGVPILVAVAWGAMGLAAYAVARTIVPRRRWIRVAVGAVALTAWDLFLDPQMVGLGLWEWAEEGPYRGVPLTNFAGWLAVSALIMVALAGILGGAEARRGLIALYTTMAVMETVGFAAVFDPPDPLVAAAGGLAMGVFAATAWACVPRHRGGRTPRTAPEAGASGTRQEVPARDAAEDLVNGAGSRDPGEGAGRGHAERAAGGSEGGPPWWR
jgi:uncharacterized membrane protein